MLTQFLIYASVFVAGFLFGSLITENVHLRKRVKDE